MAGKSELIYYLVTRITSPTISVAVDNINESMVHFDMSVGIPIYYPYMAYLIKVSGDRCLFLKLRSCEVSRYYLLVEENPYPNLYRPICGHTVNKTTE